MTSTKIPAALLPLLLLTLPAFAQTAAPEVHEATAEAAASETPATPDAPMADQVDPPLPVDDATAADAPVPVDDAAAATAPVPVAETAPAVAPVDGATPAGDAAAAAPAIGTQEQDTLRAQVLLERAHFSPGEIDGRSGKNLRLGLRGYQANRGLAVNGELDAETWLALERDAVPTLVDYTITADDVKGPFVTLPSDMIERSKLPALGYTSAQEGLGEKFHASPALLASLNPGKDLARAGEVIRAPNVVDVAGPVGATQVIVDASDGAVMLADAAGKVVAQFPASTGSKHDPLPVGDWKVTGVAMNPVFNYNPALFWDANPKHGKATLPPGPNGPVGLVWIDLSKEHYGIHGTPNPNRVGRGESHGCIRVTNWSALILSKVVATGTPVVMRD